MTNVTFNHQGDTINLLQYYEKQYNCKIKKPKQPLVVAEGRKKGETIVLIPELLLMTGIPDNFDEFRRKKISENTIRQPNDKMNDIGELIKKLRYADQLNDL